MLESSVHKIVVEMSSEEAAGFDEAFWRFVETALTRTIEPFVKLEASALLKGQRRTASFDCPDVLRQFESFRSAHCAGA